MAAVPSELELKSWSRALGKQQRRLRATQRAAKSLAQTLPEVPVRRAKNLKIRSLLVLTITGSLSLAATYLLLVPPYRNRPELFPWGPPVVEMLLGFLGSDESVN